VTNARLATRIGAVLAGLALVASCASPAEEAEPAGAADPGEEAAVDDTAPSEPDDGSEAEPDGDSDEPALREDPPDGEDPDGEDADGEGTAAAGRELGVIQAWQLTGSGLRSLSEEPNDVDRLVCPPGGVPASVWGTDVYTDDSSVCTAAVHVGIATFEEGGTVLVEHGPSQERFAGTDRNGVESEGWGAWGGSFVFIGANGRPVTGS
jgi:hypothetical protein